MAAMNTTSKVFTMVSTDRTPKADMVITTNTTVGANTTIILTATDIMTHIKPY